MNELFEQQKTELRTHKGKYATLNQFLADENNRLKLELDVERRKAPAYKVIRHSQSLVKQQQDFLNETIVELKKVRERVDNLNKQVIGLKEENKFQKSVIEIQREELLKLKKNEQRNINKNRHLYNRNSRKTGSAKH